MKKLIACGLAWTMLLGSAAAVNWPSWAADAQDWAVEQGIDESFLSTPSAELTRGKTAQLLYEAAGSPAVQEEAPFTDVDGAYEKAVAWAAAQGYVEGTGNGLFRPESRVTRQEFAAMLYRQAGEPAVSGEELHGFDDRSSVASWANDAVLWCVQQGLLEGKAEDRLEPTAHITTAEAVLILQRAQEEDTPPVSSDTVVLRGDLEAAKAQIEQELLSAVKTVRQPKKFDVSAISTQEDWTITAKNVYYSLMSQYPDYKYAYDMSVSAEGKLMQCTFSYMPYRSGDYPAGFQGIEISGLYELVVCAQENLTKESVDIRITDPTLTVDDMNQTLQQVGGGYLLCQLNRDGTAITVTPENGMTKADCLSRLEEIDHLADAVLADCITDDMTQREKATALYTYITDNVRYDRRYYDDIASMPYESRTAYGALKNDLAICGGYAQAIQILFEKAGIPCLTVQGTAGSEYHMWDLAQIDGEWAYYDATSDRGMSRFGFRHFGVATEDMQGYTWDQEFAQRLANSREAEDLL